MSLFTVWNLPDAQAHGKVLSNLLVCQNIDAK